MHRKNHSVYGVLCYLQFEASTEGLGTYHLQIRGDYCKYCFNLNNFDFPIYYLNLISKTFITPLPMSFFREQRLLLP